MTAREKAKQQSRGLIEFRASIAADMERKGYNNVSLAAELGISPVQLGRWRKHPERLTLENLRRLTAVLTIPADGYILAAGFNQIER